MKILFAPYASGREFLRAMKHDRRTGATVVSVATKARFSGGQAVILEVGFPELPNRVLLRTRALPTKGRFDGQKFQVNGTEEHRRDFLIAVASGRAQVSWSRRHRRFPVRLPVRFFVDDDGLLLRGDAETEDLASGGAALRTYRSLPPDAKVTLFLDFGDGGPELEFTGRVVWSRRKPTAGVGVQFDPVNSQQMQRLRRMIRDVKLSGKTQEGEALARQLQLARPPGARGSGKHAVSVLAEGSTSRPRAPARMDEDDDEDEDTLREPR